MSPLGMSVREDSSLPTVSHFDSKPHFRAGIWNQMATVQAIAALWHTCLCVGVRSPCDELRVVRRAAFTRGACKAISMEDLLFVLNLLVKLNLSNLCARACRNSPPPPPHGARWVGMSVHISSHAQICRDEPRPILPHLFPHHQQHNQTHIYGLYMHLKRMLMCLFSIGSLFHLG